MLKLVRVDGELTPPARTETSILLPNGLHPFGRGIFLDCDDKRISRHHGHLDVSENSVLLKALHQNPCFVIRKGEIQPQILKSGSSQLLTCGDKFGLLPKAHWYKLAKAEAPSEADELSSNTEEYMVEVKSEKGCPTEADERRKMLSPSLIPPVNGVSDGSSQSLKNTVDNELIDFPEEDGDVNEAAPDSPSLLGQNAAPTVPSPAMLKRRHSQEETETSPVKQTRTDESEAEDVKPSISTHDAAVTAGGEVPVSTLANGDSVKQEVKNEPSSPSASPLRRADPAPAGPGRERCIYGAQCYRRNAQHKLAFSHPSDADYGAGERGMCPWGAGCRRRDRRHWAVHTHPPGVTPMAPGPDRGDANNTMRRAPKRNRRPRESEAGREPDSQGLDQSNILANKRQRKVAKRPSWSGSESENEYDLDDPFMADDDSDDWVPSDEETPSDYTQSQ